MESPTTVRHKIVVLPFRNLSSDPEHAFFADGITEEIINALGQLGGVQVTSRTTAFSLKDRALSIPEIAELLQVSFVLEGSVRVAGSAIRIQANLIDTEEDFQFWSKSWNRTLDNLFEVQDEISLLIADQLREHLGHIEIGEHLVATSTKSIDAYSLTLQAKQLFNRWNPVDVKQAIELLNHALELDPYHVDAYVGLADAHGFLGTTQFADPVESWTKVHQYTQKALDLNPKHAGAHYQLANLAFFTQFDFRSAHQHAAKAIECKPNYAEAQQFMSFLYVLRGDMELSQKHLDIALEIDPLSMETRFYQAHMEYRKEDFEKALQYCEACLKDNPANIPAYTVKAYALLGLRRCAEAIAFAESQPDELVVADDKRGIACIAHLLDGNQAEFQPRFERLKAEAEEPGAIQAHAYLYVVYALQNDAENAFNLVEKSIEFKSPVMMLTFAGPFTDNLRNHERFAQLFEQLYQLDAVETLANTEKALLDDAAAEAHRAKLLTYFEEEEPYLNPDISLRGLAGDLGLHPNQLSWLINTKLGRNFNSFVNRYRIDHFKQSALNPENAHISLLGLAYESGFNSKTAFNSYFKKETGTTPKQFLKAQNS